MMRIDQLHRSQPRVAQPHRLDAMMSLLATLFLSAQVTMAIEDQTVTTLLPADRIELQRHRDVVLQALRPDLKSTLDTSEGKLIALDFLIKSTRFDAVHTYELQSLGIILGDIFVKDRGFEWVIVSDNQGRDPAIRYPDTKVILFPLTMISKRIERGEKVNVRALYSGVAKLAQKQIDDERRGR